MEVARKRPRISLDKIAATATHAEDKAHEFRLQALAPGRKKVEPVLIPSQVWGLAHISKDQFNRRLARDEFPSGTKDGARRHFKLKEAQEWVRLCHPEWQRPAGTKGAVISVCQSKGGVGKTTTAVSVAQGLTLLGWKVLLIDSDAQYSATALLHDDPRQVEGEQSLAAIYAEIEECVMPLVLKTYWSNLSLVGAHPQLQNSEYKILGRLMRDRHFQFWAMLDKALATARTQFDAIVIDTAPSMSQTALNAFWAADGLIVPTPAAMLDYDSSTHFWRLISDLAEQVRDIFGATKEFEFIHVVPTKVEGNDATTEYVRRFILESYPDFIVPVEIPKSQAVSSASLEFNTIYDIARYQGNQKTYARVREAYDRLVELTAQSIMAMWAEQAGTPTPVFGESEGATA